MATIDGEPGENRYGNGLGRTTADSFWEIRPLHVTGCKSVVAGDARSFGCDVERAVRPACAIGAIRASQSSSSGSPE